jgi:aryl-alcohol dehydrogenase-like predicted oxidoreductase
MQLSGTSLAEQGFGPAPLRTSCDPMQKRTLGRTGLAVSEIGHGLWGMGDWSGSSDAQSFGALRASHVRGCTFYDSALAYGVGRSDALLGRLIAGDAEHDIVTAGKVPPKNERWPASSSDRFTDVFPLDHVIACAEASRAAMHVSAIDLLQLHVWDDSWADDPEFSRVAAALKDRGLARHLGISLNRWEPWNGIKAIRTGLVDTVQVIYNIFDQAPEDELLPECARLHVGVIARVPLDEGSLGGRMTPETRFAPGDWRATYFGPENLAPTLRRVEALKRVVPAGMTLPEMALRFILSKPTVSTIVVGMRSIENVTRDVAVSDGVRLDDRLMAELRRHRWDRKPAPWSD